MLKQLFVFFIKIYRKYISCILKSSCIFTPSCSVYALEALKKHNFFTASFLIIWRLLRCNSLNKGGYDPVPDNFNLKKWLL